MTKGDFTTLISELTEEERKPVEEWVAMLQAMLRQCEGYLRSYGTGDQNVFKLLQVMDATRALIGDARIDLIESHKIPDYPKGD